MSAFKPDESEGYLVNQAARVFARALARRASDVGGVPAHFPVFLALENGSLSQADLVERAKVEQGSMAELLKRMESNGLLTRRRDPHDARRVLYSMTAKGKRILSGMKEAAIEVNNVAAEGLNAGERKELRRLLLHATNNLLRAEE